MSDESKRQLAAQQKDYYNKREALANSLVDALCARYKEITGAWPSDKVQTAIYDAIRFDC